MMLLNKLPALPDPDWPHADSL